MPVSHHRRQSLAMNVRPIAILAATVLLSAACASVAQKPAPPVPAASTVRDAAAAGASDLGLTDGPWSCRRTDVTYGAEFTDAEFDCDNAVHCGVEPGIVVDGTPTTFFYCTRPTGDSFSMDEVCVIRAGGETSVDPARTEALKTGDDFPCPFHWEDAPSAWGDDHP